MITAKITFKYNIPSLLLLSDKTVISYHQLPTNYIIVLSMSTIKLRVSWITLSKIGTEYHNFVVVDAIIKQVKK
ncbi:MAG: hypothetical protein KAS32_02220 [Candidatus Peribacteraceae bacterium]|nr:hypothetical protein [Candidatus Peribacteraceae bacterium]